MQRTNRILRLLPSLGLGLLFLLPLSVWAANLITNDGLEPPFVPYDTYNGPDGRVWNLQVAHDWEKFIVPDGTYQDGSRLRFFSASDWAAFNGSPVVEKRDGVDAQVWWSSKKFETGVYQQVSGLTVGEDYGFQAGVLQVFETTNRTDPAAGNMLRSVGIDPYGGTDPEAATVMWGPEEPNATYTDHRAKVYLVLSRCRGAGDVYDGDRVCAR